MEAEDYSQEMGNTERLPCPGAPQGPAQFQYYSGHCGLCIMSAVKTPANTAAIVWHLGAQ